MNRYSVMTEGKRSGSNTVCETTGAVIDAVLHGMKYGEKITIVEIPPGLDGKPETVSTGQTDA